MILIEEEPTELQLMFRVLERCYFCNNKTSTWNTFTNQPVCKACAQVHSQEELTKSHPDYVPPAGR